MNWALSSYPVSEDGARISLEDDVARMKTPLVTEIQRFSLQDGPGVRTTVFLKGCPLRCPWCHNPESLNPKQEIYHHARRCTVCGRCTRACPAGALAVDAGAWDKSAIVIDRSKCILCLNCEKACLEGAREAVGREVDIPSLVQEVLADKVFFKHSQGGVTISGGEPLLFPEFVGQLASSLKEENIHIAVETCGFAKWEEIEPLLDIVDLFIVDIKSMDAEKYKECLGGSLEVVLANLEKIIDSGTAVRVHLPIIPGFNDSRADTEAYVDYLGRFNGKLAGVDILPYHSYATAKYHQLGRAYHYQGVADLDIPEVLPLGRALKGKGISQVTVGGIVGTKGPFGCTRTA